MLKKTPLLLRLTAGLISIIPAWADVPVIPRPAEELAPEGTPLEGYARLAQDASKVFMATPATRINAATDLSKEAAMLKEFIAKSPSINTSKSTTVIDLSIDSKLPAEGYRLKVGPDRISIEGGDAAGVFYGIQSLNQMLIVGKDQKWAGIPPMTITDAPSTTWRGAMLDSARHFKPVAFMKKFIDTMALHKLNRLHWHLVDSEGWRLEVKKYPKLTEVCKDFPAVYPGEDPSDKSRPARFMYGHFHGGGYYTQDEIRDIVQYAKDRHIEIMPEIEFPGHSMVALTAYPEFSTTGKAPTDRSNISSALYGPNEKALGFLKDVLDETMDLFPFEMIHFGGDEAPKGEWKNSPEAQAKIKELGLKDEDALQAWMFNELAEHIAKRGKRPAGWEEIMHGSNMDHLTKKAVIMPWLSINNAVKSANNGYGVIHTSTCPFYFDSWQTDSPAENWALYRGFTMDKVYNFNMFPDTLTEDGKKNIMGVQAQLWAELMPYTDNVEYQAYPRLSALSELAWTPSEKLNYKEFYKRLLNHEAVYKAYNIKNRYIDPLPIAEWTPELLKKPEAIIAIPAEIITKAWGTDSNGKSHGEMVVQFDYKGGASGLDILKVELLQNGKIVSTDAHKGFTGTRKEDNTYRLKFHNPKPEGYSLRITHENTQGKQDSRGDITIYTGKGLELFDPRNFAGGDYPTLQWTSDDTKAKLSTLRIPMDGVVREAGPHELIFTMKDLKHPAFVGDISIQGTSGTGTTSKAHATLDAAADTAIIPLDITSNDIKPGNSIVFKIKTDQAAGGNVRIRQTKTMPVKAPGIYLWNPDILTGNTVIAYIKGIKAEANGKFNISFDYRAGGNALDIKSVQILEKGKTIASSNQAGFAGNNPKDNKYTLESPRIRQGQTYDIRMIISGAGGQDSHGEVSIH